MTQMSDIAYKRYTAENPDLGTDAVSTEPSRSAEWFESERNAIFQRSWLNVGRVEELPEAGDYLVKEIQVCRTSVLLVRGKDDKIRGFHNVCKHRGNTLVWHASGQCRGHFACNFHGWVYDDKGKLRDVPDAENFYKLDKSSLGLSEVATDIWQGFIFVCMQPTETLQEYLGEIPSLLNDYPFARFSTRFTYEANEQVNWKVLLDAQQEGYHVPYLHKRTIMLSFPKDMTQYRSKSFQTFGNHRRLATGPSKNFETTPTGSVAAKLGPTSVEAFAGAFGDGGEAKSMEGVFDFWVLFPNFVIGLLYGTYFTYNIWPLAVDRSIWEVRMYYPEAENAGQLFSNEYGKVAFRDTLLEDASTHERVQGGVMSGAIKSFHFQDEEIMARHGHKVVRDIIEAFSAS
jgi:phenylpropionate dioxygenase-like ring-hydroxylating dioxygenase large terminal subunit